MAHGPEISDEIVAVDPATGARRAVSRAAVVERFRALGDERAARIVGRLPATGGMLDDAAVDRAIARAHAALDAHVPRLTIVLDAIARALQEHGSSVSVTSSIGRLHHHRGNALIDAFLRHDAPAFAHLDFRPSPVALLRARVFHLVSGPVARHDGLLSVRRAHSSAALLAAAKAGCPGFASGFFARARTSQILVGVRLHLRDSFVRALGPRAADLEAFL